MIYPRIIEALYRKPLAISREGFDAIDAIVRPRLLAGQQLDFKKIHADSGGETDFFGNPLPQMTIENGIAIIPVCGPLLQHASMLDKICGACSYDDIRKNISEAIGLVDTRGIILNFNTPGGQVCGLLECSEFIADIAQNRCPIVGFTDTSCCSAGYHLIVGCTAIYASRSSYIGNIGTIMSFLDTSKAFEMEGLKPEVFTSGKFKSAGTAGTTLTDEQRAYLQGLVDDSFASFQNHILAHRDVPAEAMEGQVFHGSQAQSVSVIDGIVDDLDGAIEELEMLIG